MARKLAASIPPITVVPMIWRATEPAPVAIHKGTLPRMKANDVIKMGRSRMRAPASAASMSGLPCSYSSFANSTIKIAFFAARPISITSPICEYTSLSICTIYGGKNHPEIVRRNQSVTNAPNTATGVLSNTLNGSDQLSYSAARIRKTNRSENPKTAVGETPCCASFS